MKFYWMWLGMLGLPYVFKITNFQCFLKDLGYCINCLHVVEHAWKLQFDQVIFAECGQADLGMPIVLGNNKSISQKKVE